MLSKEDFLVIKARAKRGVYHKPIAADLGIHPKTVRRALKRAAAPARTRLKRGSNLAPVRASVDALLADGVWNAGVILRELHAKGYQGGITVLRDYIRPKCVLRPSRATVRFETEPGRQLQSDWGEITTRIAGQPTKVYFIVNHLASSRRFPVWATARLDAEHTYEGLIRSFLSFGGVAHEVRVDNQPAAVLHHLPDDVQFSPRFVDLAQHYGFPPRAWRPYRTRTKGTDERMVGYRKQPFFVRYRSFESGAHLNQLLEPWLRTAAAVRCHGTRKAGVNERFDRELPTLQALPAWRYDVAYHETRVVSWDSYVEVRGNRYSVPAAYGGQTVSVRKCGMGDRCRASCPPVAHHP